MSSIQSYQSTVKIHNWYENQLIDNEKTHTLQKAYHSNTLLSSARNTLLNHTLQPSALSHTTHNNQLYNNQSIMLYNYHTHGVLSTDISELINVATNNINSCNYAASTSTLTPSHVLRNTFTVELVHDNKQSYDRNNNAHHVVNYHQKVRFVCHNELSNEKLYLASIIKSHLNYSQKSKTQLVYITNNCNDYNTQWSIELGDVQYRIEAELQPVNTTQSCVIVHCATQQPLSSHTQSTILNIYGSEYEVSCQSSSTSQGKKYQLQHEQNGIISSDTGSKQYDIMNVWSILMDSPLQHDT